MGGRRDGRVRSLDGAILLGLHLDLQLVFEFEHFVLNLHRGFLLFLGKEGVIKAASRIKCVPLRDLAELGGLGVVVGICVSLGAGSGFLHQRGFGLDEPVLEAQVATAVLETKGFL